MDQTIIQWLSINKKWVFMFILMIIAVVCFIVFAVPHIKSSSKHKSSKKSKKGTFINIVDFFAQKKENFNPNYIKELNLFQSMSPNAQQEYLNMSKDEKLVKYGHSLM